MWASHQRMRLRGLALRLRWHGKARHPEWEDPEGVSPTPVGQDEVLVKKWVLRRVKQQVSSSPERQRLARGG